MAACATCNLEKSDRDWLEWYREQKFWSEEREFAIWQWLSNNHEMSISAREYEELRKKPIKLPPSITSDEE